MTNNRKDVDDINKRNRIIIIFLFLIYPFGSLPFILYEIYNRKKYAYNLFAILWGMVGMLYAPNGDLYRYYLDYFNYSNLNYEEFNYLILLQGKIDMGLPYLQWVFSNLRIPNDIIVFIFVSFGTYCILSITFYLLEKYTKNKLKAFIIFIIIFLYFSFLGFYFRYGFGSAVFSYGCYLILYRKDNSGWWIIMLSILFHFSMAIFSVLLFLIKVSNIRLGKNIFLIFSITSFLFSSDIISEILLNIGFSQNIQSKIIEYTEGYWASEWLKDRSIGALMMSYFNIFSKIVVYYIIYKTYKEDSFHTLLTAIIIITTLVAPFATIKARFDWTFNLLSIMAIIPGILNYRIFSKYKRKVFVSLFLIIGIVNSFSGLVFKRFILPLSDEKELLYNSALGILTHKYSYEWLEHHSKLGE